MARTKFYTTGSDFFQVISETAKSVVVRPVKSECLDITTVYTAFDYDVKHRAIKNDFTTVWYFNDKQNKNGKRCKRNSFDDSICINSYYTINAYPTNGTEVYNRNLG